jgi:hypothetical protein|tara:strand:- start:1 stop:111 length:111 start_codon:yes stop_codon:yes gene_type:complete
MKVKEVKELAEQLLIAFVFIMVLLLGATAIYLQGIS